MSRPLRLAMLVSSGSVLRFEGIQSRGRGRRECRDRVRYFDSVVRWIMGRSGRPGRFWVNTQPRPRRPCQAGQGAASDAVDENRLHDANHRGMFPVLHLDAVLPSGGTMGTIGALRHHALEAHVADGAKQVRTDLALLSNDAAKMPSGRPLGLSHDSGKPRRSSPTSARISKA